MSKSNSRTPIRPNQNRTSLDKFEQFSRIVTTHTFWFKFLQLVAIVAFFAYTDATTATEAACFIAALGTASNVKELISKLSRREDNSPNSGATTSQH